MAIEGGGDSLNENVADAQMKLPPLCLTRPACQPKKLFINHERDGRRIGCNERACPPPELNGAAASLFTFRGSTRKEKLPGRPASGVLFFFFFVILNDRFDFVGR